MADLWNVGGPSGVLRVAVDDIGMFRLETGIAMKGPIQTMGTPGAPQASGDINNFSLGSLAVSLVHAYPANGAAVLVYGVVPFREGHILILHNLNSTEGTNFVGVVSDNGASSTAQNRFGKQYDNVGQQHVRIGGGCSAAWRYHGVIGSGSRWRLLWLGGAELNSLA